MDQNLQPTSDPVKADWIDVSTLSIQPVISDPNSLPTWVFDHLQNDFELTEVSNNIYLGKEAVANAKRTNEELYEMKLVVSELNLLLFGEENQGDSFALFDDPAALPAEEDMQNNDGSTAQQKHAYRSHFHILKMIQQNLLPELDQLRNMRDELGIVSNEDLLDVKAALADVHNTNSQALAARNDRNEIAAIQHYFPGPEGNNIPEAIRAQQEELARLRAMFMSQGGQSLNVSQGIAADQGNNTLNNMNNSDNSPTAVTGTPMDRYAVTGGSSNMQQQHSGAPKSQACSIM